MTTQTSPHWCAAWLVFTRQADGHSYERCTNCGWFYGFGEGQSASVVRSQGARSA